jgi:uncharacterized damage-inducible protein DinB
MNTLAQEFKNELLAEAPATRKCIERLKEDLFDYKPHEKSMKMSGLAMMMAEMPKWVATIVDVGVIDFHTWERYNMTTIADLLNYFDKNLESAIKALDGTTDDTLKNETFILKMGDKELMKDSRSASVGSTLNHWVHHRGQLTVYMRLNNIPVPSLYGPSADEGGF